MNQDTTQDPNQQAPRTPLGPDRETLHRTDPQEHMKGPLSSLMHNISEEGEKSDREDPVPPGGSDEERNHRPE